MWLVRGVTFASLLSLCGASVLPVHSQNAVDAATFLTAFRSGTADQYKGRTIAGTGFAFGMSKPVLITVGAAADDKQVTPVTTWDQLTAAQNARTTLQAMISVADFDPTSMSGNDVESQRVLECREFRVGREYASGPAGQEPSE